MEKATFAAGCFWHVEEAFSKIKGVVSTRVGYTGGTFEAPTYEDVCTGETGHAEAVEVEFDPGIISYDRLLEIFWDIHDPTTPDRQGVDVGSQYRSAIFFHTAEQEKKALLSRERLQKSGRFKDPVVTEVRPVEKFYEAEEYHQGYFQKRGVGSRG